MKRLPKPTPRQILIVLHDLAATAAAIVDARARARSATDVGIPGIVATKPVQPSLDAIRAWVATLEQGLARNERAVIYNVLRDAVPEFRGEAA